MALKAQSGAAGTKASLSRQSDQPGVTGARGASRTTAAKAVRTRTVEITGILRDEILRGQYRAGERLPSERELAARFQVNRGAVREALKRLEQLGIATVQPGGVRVVPIEDATLEVLGHLMDLNPVPDPRLVGQLLEVMGALLAMSARTAVERADHEQVDLAQQLVRRIARSESAAERQQAWRELGDLFNQINGNLVLRLIANGLKTQFMGRLERIGIEFKLDDEHAMAAIDELDCALADRNAVAVAAALQGHFNLVREKLLAEINASSQLRTTTSGHA